jgi:hypothetical protein
MPLNGPNVVTAVIANGQSLSGAAFIGVGRLVGIDWPAFTSAALTFQVSIDGVTYRDALDSASAEIAVTASTGDKYIQAPASLVGAPYLKVRSGTSGSPVAQGAARTLSFIVA